MSMHKGLIGQSEGGGSIGSSFANAQEKTLSDYINRKYKQDAFEANRMTYNAWLNYRFPAGFENFDGNLSENDLRQCWIAAGGKM